MSVRTRRAGGGGGGGGGSSSGSGSSSARASSDDGIEDPLYSKTGGKRQRRRGSAGLLLAAVAVASALAALVIKVGFERRFTERMKGTEFASFISNWLCSPRLALNFFRVATAAGLLLPLSTSTSEITFRQRHTKKNRSTSRSRSRPPSSSPSSAPPGRTSEAAWETCSRPSDGEGSRARAPWRSTSRSLTRCSTGGSRRRPTRSKGRGTSTARAPLSGTRSLTRRAR